MHANLVLDSSSNSESSNPPLPSTNKPTQVLMGVSNHSFSDFKMAAGFSRRHGATVLNILHYKQVVCIDNWKSVLKDLIAKTLAILRQQILLRSMYTPFSNTT